MKIFKIEKHERDVTYNIQHTIQQQTTFHTSILQTNNISINTDQS